MKVKPYGDAHGKPPDFAEARNKRQKVRAAGMDPDYWYAVEYESVLRPGQTAEVMFWNQPIALYRGMDGCLHALENRCAHRQLKLSLGEVNGCHLTCQYHGWTYDGAGNVVHYAHDLFGRSQPEVTIRCYPVSTRYGLIWLFPGDPALADHRSIPVIPELTGPQPWARIDAGFTLKAHHSMVIDNISDFTHAYLHRKYKPFWDATLADCEMRGDKVYLRYDTVIGGGRFTKLMVDRERADTTKIDLCFDYPYQRSDTGGSIKHWCFVLPMDRSTTKVFFIFYFDALKIPFTSTRIPYPAMGPLMKIAGRFSVIPLLRQDCWAVEAEQAGYETHFSAPIVELNPAVHLFQDLTIRKWQEYLDRTAVLAVRKPAISQAAARLPVAGGAPET